MEKLPSCQITFTLNFSQLAAICKTGMIRVRDCVLGMSSKTGEPTLADFSGEGLCVKTQDLSEQVLENNAIGKVTSLRLVLLPVGKQK